MTAPAACGVSAQVDADMGDLLARQLDAFARVIGQRDQARRIAVQLEQENAELRRRVALLADYFASEPDRAHKGRFIAHDIRDTLAGGTGGDR